MKVLPGTGAPIEDIHKMGWGDGPALSTGRRQPPGRFRRLAGRVEGQEVLAAGQNVVEDGGRLLSVEDPVASVAKVSSIRIKTWVRLFQSGFKSRCGIEVLELYSGLKQLLVFICKSRYRTLQTSL